MRLGTKYNNFVENKIEKVVTKILSLQSAVWIEKGVPHKMLHLNSGYGYIFMWYYMEDILRLMQARLYKLSVFREETASDSQNLKID